MFADDGEYGGEAEAGAVLLGGEKGGPDFFEVLGGDAAAVVARFELDVVAVGEAGDLVFGEGEIARAELHAADVGRGRHRLNGVEDEVLKNLEDLRAVDGEGIGAGRDRDVDDRGGAGGGEAEGVVKYLLRGDGGAGDDAAFRDEEELLGEAFCGEAGFLGVGERGGVLRLDGERDGAEDGGEEIVEIVGDAAGELAEGFRSGWRGRVRRG